MASGHSSPVALHAALGGRVRFAVPRCSTALGDPRVSLIQRLSRLVSQTLLAQLKIGLTPNSATMGLTHVNTLRIPRVSSHESQVPLKSHPAKRLQVAKVWMCIHWKSAELEEFRCMRNNSRKGSKVIQIQGASALLRNNRGQENQKRNFEKVIQFYCFWPQSNTVEQIFDTHIVSCAGGVECCGVGGVWCWCLWVFCGPVP